MDHDEFPKRDADGVAQAFVGGRMNDRYWHGGAPVSSQATAFFLRA